MDLQKRNFNCKFSYKFAQEFPNVRLLSLQGLILLQICYRFARVQTLWFAIKFDKLANLLQEISLP